jgi:hypothetical protein
MKRYAVHNTGDYVRSNAGTSATRTPASIQEFDTLDNMHPFDRAQFEWMLEHGQIVISMGSTVYQIRGAA